MFTQYNKETHTQIIDFGTRIALAIVENCFLQQAIKKHFGVAQTLRQLTCECFVVGDCNNFLVFNLFSNCLFEGFD